MAVVQTLSAPRGSWPERQPERWTATGATNAARLRSWSTILAETLVPLEVSPGSAPPPLFTAAVTRRRVADLMLVDCACSPFAGHRDAAVIGADGPAPEDDVIGLQFVVRGVEAVRNKGGELIVTAGHAVLWDGHQAVEVEAVEPFHKRTLLFPRQRVLAICPRLAQLDALPPIGEMGPGRLLVRYMNALALEHPRLDAEAAAAASDAALELLRAVVEPGLPTAREVERSALQAEIRRYIRSHLGDPELAPGSIARAFSMSLRTLHALFEDADASVAVLVRNERLARCEEDLRRTNGGAVTDIACRWGFSDAAHFSRVFKRHYGVTPTEARQAALAASD